MPKDKGYYPAGKSLGMKPRNKMSKAKRAMRDRSTKGSPPMEMPEFRAGYRSIT